MDKEVLFTVVKDNFVETLDLPLDSISPEKKLDDDLGLDSLDMVDFVISLNDKEGLFTEQVEPSLFKEAKTVQDVVDLLTPFWK